MPKCRAGDERFCVGCQRGFCTAKLAWRTYVIVYVSENLLGCYNEMCHLPYCLPSVSGPLSKRRWQSRGMPTVSKSMDVNLNSRRKKGGIRIVFPRRCEEDMAAVQGFQQMYTRNAIELRCLEMWPSPPSRLTSLGNVAVLVDFDQQSVDAGHTSPKTWDFRYC